MVTSTGRKQKVPWYSERPLSGRQNMLEVDSSKLNCHQVTGVRVPVWSSMLYENSSAGIPSPSLALFIVMLPKAHLTLDSRMSDSR